MTATLDITEQELEKLYARIASDYCSSLPLEHFAKEIAILKAAQAG